MKNNHRPIRLGKFEQLESRALLAHVGLPRGMHFEMRDVRTTFDHSPRIEMQSREHDSRAAHSYISARAPRGDSPFNINLVLPIQPNSAAAPAVDFIPSAPVLVIITLPSPVSAAPAFSEPLKNPVRETPPPSQLVSSVNNPPSSNWQSSSSNRAPNSADRASASLSNFSDLALQPLTNAETSAATETDNGVQPTDSDDQPARQEQGSQQFLRQPAANPATLQIETDEEAELIELDPDELLKRTKRKSVRAATSTNLETFPWRESTLPEEQRLPRVELLPVETWQSLSQPEEVCVPFNDDLIELLAGDQLENVPALTAPAIPFLSSGNLQLEASYGFHQATEHQATAIAAAAIPVAANPATVAAALPSREAQ